MGFFTNIVNDFYRGLNTSLKQTCDFGGSLKVDLVLDVFQDLFL